jgi:hypothetical protein
MIDLQRVAQEEALSMAQAARGDQEPLIGRARWRSMGELHLGHFVGGCIIKEPGTFGPSCGSLLVKPANRACQHSY